MGSGPEGGRNVKITVISGRPGVPEEEYEVAAVPRVGEIVSTRLMAAARVEEVKWMLTSGKVLVHAK
jgi:hypothetical protein